jgi:peptide/nickel transport system permease protein
MAVTTLTKTGSAANNEMPRSLTQQRIRLTLREPMFIIGTLIVLFWICMALFGPALRPYKYTEMASTPWVNPGGKFWLGTDRMGRDLFTRIAMGARLMLLVPTVSVLLGVLFGASVGLVTGYMGGIVDDVVMRLMDIMMAFPMLMLYLLIIFAIGPSVYNVVIAIAIGATPGIARLVRGLTMDIRNREYIIAAQMRGESSLYIMFR